MNVLVNKMLGPSYNAAITISTSLSSHTMTLSSSMVGAFNPAITNAVGAGDRTRMMSLVNKTCKFGAALVLPFAIPLSLEIDQILIIWLKNPPSGVNILSIWMMVVLVFENMTHVMKDWASEDRLEQIVNVYVNSQLPLTEGLTSTISQFIANIK
jgi:O-antigen/teichoic acid export membrane protein